MTRSLVGGRIESRLRWLLVSVVGLLIVLAPSVAAQSDRNAAGLVVRHGDGSMIYAYVEFDEPSISGDELLLRSGLDVTVAPYGGLGSGVCMINGEGCPADNCFCESYSSPAYFWHYFALENGSWAPLPVGPTARQLRDGDVDGWSWTAGEHGLPVVTIEDIARLAGVVPEPTPTSTPAPDPEPSPTATSTATAPPTATVTATWTPGPPTNTAVVSAMPSPSPTARPSPTMSPTATSTASPSPTHTSSPTNTPASAVVAVDPAGTATEFVPSSPSDDRGSDLVMFGVVAGGVVLIGAGALLARQRHGARS